MTTKHYRRLLRLRFRLAFLRGLGLEPTSTLIGAMALAEADR